MTLAIPELPAPWSLTGTGLIMVLKGQRLLMVVDYQTADCGPYQELLYIPGKAVFGGQKRYTISDIYVSTISSVRAMSATAACWRASPSVSAVR